MIDKWSQGIIEIMRNEGAKLNPSSIQLGVIKSVSPLQVDLGGLPLGRENLYINKQLLDWTETVQATTSSNDTISTIEHKSCLNVGDIVLLYSINNKYVMMGVVE